MLSLVLTKVERALSRILSLYPPPAAPDSADRVQSEVPYVSDY
jgi:hypothetical protein